jgi:hypothetical protein
MPLGDELASENRDNNRAARTCREHGPAPRITPMTMSARPIFARFVS